jgi:predicted Zn finger-like uncharacterized protein
MADDEVAMRLTCPNCGAEYDVADGMVPTAGRHVQCTVCHTRWFVRGASEVPTEDQILYRLEGRTARPRENTGSGSGDGKVITLGRTSVPQAIRPVPTTPPPQAEPAPAEPARPEPRRPTVVGKPEAQPSVSRPAATSRDAPQRAALRLDLDSARPAPERRPPSRSRFLHGLLLVLVPVLVAAGIYRFNESLAVSVPAAAPALDAYETFVDDVRDDIERQIEDFRAPSEPG